MCVVHYDWNILTCLCGGSDVEVGAGEEEQRTCSQQAARHYAQHQSLIQQLIEWSFCLHSWPNIRPSGQEVNRI